MLPEGKHCAPPGFTSCLLALTALHILQRCPISWSISKSGSNIMLPLEESSTPRQQQEAIMLTPSSALLVMIILMCGRRRGPHHISNDVVVPALSSVHSQDAKHNKNHRPSVDQWTHSRVATCTTAARVEAKRLGWLSFGSGWRICENRIKEKKFFKAFIYTESKYVYMLSTAVKTLRGVQRVPF